MLGRRGRGGGAITTKKYLRNNLYQTKKNLFKLEEKSNKGLREAIKNNIENVIMIIPPRTPPPSFWTTVIALGQFLCACFFWSEYKVCFGDSKRHLKGTSQERTYRQKYRRTHRQTDIATYRLNRPRACKRMMYLYAIYTRTYIMV